LNPPRDQEALSLQGAFASGAAGSIFLWGASFVAAKEALSGFSPWSMVAGRFALGALLLYGWLALRRATLLPRREDRGRCLMLGLILGLHIVAQGYALYSTSAANSGWIVGFGPVIIAIGARLFLREPISARSWAGIGIATAGMGWILLPGAELEAFQPGDWIVFGTTFSWAAYTLLSARPVAGSGALVTSAAAMGVASLISIAAATIEGRWLVAVPSATAWSAILFLGLGCSGLAFAFWNRALARFGAAQLSGLIYFQPLVTLALSMLWLGEELRAHVALGGAVVLFGVFWLSRGKRA
jgi:drug/metabolite transporter (DMT)-like permease